ncbi:hypothetical protein KTH_07060 [Thermosporothrix hazakensis]|jgi:hypothetical protein|uniref:Uncharacterized protein n=1 Tax=Thermosporothrix sp. COM3 TaxID=2490863 RepID=A0A455SKZ1_9CHLR|nr:hypothetical protein KTC_04850 [Thermosporothrix sp. COM3]GCE45837.1 hypothetical protein KTH_07060 [Thermosporothrix hazakensis]
MPFCAEARSRIGGLPAREHLSTEKLAPSLAIRSGGSAIVLLPVYKRCEIRAKQVIIEKVKNCSDTIWRRENEYTLY